MVTNEAPMRKNRISILLPLLSFICWQMAHSNGVEERIMVIPVEGEINKGMVYLVRRAIGEAEQSNARALVLHMNTNGGRLDATEEIMEELSHTTVETITYVDRKAFSAGAFIAVATRSIYMAPGSVIGAATPVLAGPQGPEKLSKSFEEKITSATRAMIRSAAAHNDHPVKVVEAMVDKDIEIPGIIDKGKLLTLTNEEAARSEIALSKGTYADVESMLTSRDVENAKIIRLQPLWSEKLAIFLTNSAISGILMMLGMLGLYLEFKTPGFGLPGIAGITALALFFWGHHIAGLAGFEEIVILFIGLFLLALEILVIPGFGMAGIGGILAVITAIFMAMIKRFPGTPVIPDLTELYKPLLSLSIGLVGTFLGGVALFRFLPGGGSRYGIILRANENRGEGFSSISRPLETLVGKHGVAITPLRPAGKARFGESLIDVITEGGYVDNQSALRVLAVEGARVIVEAVEEENEEQPI